MFNTKDRDEKQKLQLQDDKNKMECYEHLSVRGAARLDFVKDKK